MANPNYQFTKFPNYQFSSVIVFDGVCNLCNGFVRFVIARDTKRRFTFRFAGPNAEFISLIEDGHVFTRSTAALRIARQLRYPWPLAYALIVAPRPLRDWLYDRVARNRYRWFGRREACMIPTPDILARFDTR